MSLASRVARRFRRSASLSDNPEKWRAKTRSWPKEKGKFTRDTTFKAYTLHWRHNRHSDFDDFDIVATVDEGGTELVVGNLFYGPWNGDPTQEALEGAVEVAPDHRRRGLATAMYSWAERLSGKKFRPASSNTDAAKALWHQKHRPFGE